MPTYEYRCDACEHEWEEFKSITAKPTKKCPECKKQKAKRIISAGGGLIFKGSGFYQTDYRSDSYKKGASAEKKASESKASDSSTSSSSSSKKSDSSTKSAASE
ncbi:FmdB family zinc ribbon protein [Fuerstiella marisgermanici]|uniref:Putative regulatory protein, FmdB family n=1 Tax=Fuerstiella marisgermanici TaxID=1891926 RepID=A0A1P8WHR4_9PLAN|nr:zinc ribbon domain-containing protein [Fuerstiella marisgermanici]APZ93567.1 putative regulatory protein, FmdB family [Fuerstiella marisgermanici]